MRSCFGLDGSWRGRMLADACMRPYKEKTKTKKKKEKKKRKKKEKKNNLPRGIENGSKGQKSWQEGRLYVVMHTHAASSLQVMLPETANCRNAIDWSLMIWPSARILIHSFCRFDPSIGTNEAVLGEAVKLMMHVAYAAMRIHSCWGQYWLMLLPAFAYSLVRLNFPYWGLHS